MNRNKLTLSILIVGILLVILAVIGVYWVNLSKETSKTATTPKNNTQGSHDKEEAKIAESESKDENNRQTAAEISAKIGSPSGTNWSIKYETTGSLQGYFRISIDAKNDLETFKKARDESFAVFKNAGYDPCGENLKGTISIEPDNMPQNANLTSYNPC